MVPSFLIHGLFYDENANIIQENASAELIINLVSQLSTIVLVWTRGQKAN